MRSDPQEGLVDRPLAGRHHSPLDRGHTGTDDTTGLEVRTDQAEQHEWTVVFQCPFDQPVPEGLEVTAIGPTEPEVLLDRCHVLAAGLITVAVGPQRGRLDAELVDDKSQQLGRNGDQIVGHEAQPSEPTDLETTGQTPTRPVATPDQGQVGLGQYEAAGSVIVDLDGKPFERGTLPSTDEPASIPTIPLRQW